MRPDPFVGGKLHVLQSIRFDLSVFFPPPNAPPIFLFAPFDVGAFPWPPRQIYRFARWPKTSVRQRFCNPSCPPFEPNLTVFEIGAKVYFPFFSATRHISRASGPIGIPPSCPECDRLLFVPGRGASLTFFRGGSRDRRFFSLLRTEA